MTCTMAFDKLRVWYRSVKRWPATRQIALASVVLALCSMVIALSSLAFSIYQASIAREHDRLSAKPRLIITYYSNEAGAGWGIANDGAGSARIRGFKMLIDGIDQKVNGNLPDILAPLQLPTPNTVNFLNPAAGVIIPSQGSKRMLWVSSEAGAKTLTAKHNRVTFEMCYCSIYEECWLFATSTGRLDGKRDNTCSSFLDEPKSVWWDG